MKKGNKNALKKNINAEMVEALAARFWTKTEIAAFFNCSHNTVTNRFENDFLKGREVGKSRLRDWQLAAAQRGNVVMLIWLGKQILGQRDNFMDDDLSSDEIAKLKQLAQNEIQKNS